MGPAAKAKQQRLIAIKVWKEASHLPLSEWIKGKVTIEPDDYTEANVCGLRRVGKKENGGGGVEGEKDDDTEKTPPGGSSKTNSE